MKSNIERRLRRLEAKSSHGAQTILVVEKLGDEKAYESYQRGLVDIVIAPMTKGNESSTMMPSHFERCWWRK
jgi:hypothetical protein